MRARGLSAVVLFAAASLAAGCGGSPKRIADAAPQFFPVGCEKEPWKIEGFFTEGEGYTDEPRRNLVVKIDGQTAISGDLSGKADMSGEVNGKHQDHVVTAVCSAKPRPGAPDDEVPELRCVIMIDNKRTVTLSF